jgi:hypothetical protein
MDCFQVLLSVFSLRRYTKAPLTAPESGGRDGGHGNGRDIGCARSPGDAKRLKTESGGGGRSGGGGGRGLHSVHSSAQPEPHSSLTD